MTWPTTRQHPRSLAQAFPREHANPIEFYPAPLSRAAHAVVCIAGSAFIGWLVYLGV